MEDGGRLSDLRSQGKALADDLATARKELRAARRQDARAKIKAQAQWTLAPAGGDGVVSIQSLPDFSKVALILYDKAGGKPDAAAAFLAREAAKKHWEQKPVEAVEELVRELFLKVVLPEYVSLCDMQSSSDFAAMGAALRFWEEWALVVWAKDANRRLGVAPSTEAVLEKAERLRQELPADWRPPGKGSAASATARSWCKRWRRRWGGRIGAVRARDDVTPGEIRDKASLRTLLYPLVLQFPATVSFFFGGGAEKISNKYV